MRSGNRAKSRVLHSHGHALRIKSSERRWSNGRGHTKCSVGCAAHDIKAGGQCRGRLHHVVANLELADVGLRSHLHVQHRFSRSWEVLRGAKITEIDPALRLRLHVTFETVALRQASQKPNVGTALHGKI